MASLYLHFVLPVDSLLIRCRWFPVILEAFAEFKPQKRLFNSSAVLEGVRSQLCPKGTSLRKHCFWLLFVPLLVGGSIASLPVSSHVSGSWCLFLCILFLGSSYSCRIHEISKAFVVRTLCCIFIEKKKKTRKSRVRKQWRNASQICLLFSLLYVY